ncbi:MAG: Fic family protein [Verrucomicrobiota bacterium]
MISEPIITKEILNLISEIDEFKGQWRALKTLSPEMLNQLRRIATIESIGSSTRIEGAKLSDKEVAALLANLKIESFQNRDEEEVAGYGEAMDLVFDSWESMPITENSIHQLHRVLLQYSTKDARHRGDYKKNPNNVAAFDESGQQVGIVFETATPFETPFEMEKLMDWWEKAQKEDQLHPLLMIGMFIVWFLAIHPFQDGNGRLSRIITTFLLLRFGYAYAPYSSLESVIEENKSGYYTALRKTQQTLKSEQPDWETWLTFFLRCLARQKERLSRKIATEQEVLMDLSELATSIIALFETKTKVTVAEAVKATGANRNTVKASLQGLVKRGLIVQQGKGRGAHYTLLI